MRGLKVLKKGIVLAIAGAMLAAPAAAQATTLNVGGALVVEQAASNQKASEADKEVATNAIQDYMQMCISQGKDSAKVAEAAQKYLDKVSSTGTTHGLNDLVSAAKTAMDNCDVTPEKEKTLEEIKADAAKTINDYAIVMQQDTYDPAEVEYLRSHAIADMKGIQDAAGVAELVAKTKERMAALERKNAPKEEVEPALPAPDDYVQVGGNWVTPVATYGQRVNVVLPIVNMAKDNAYDVIVTPVLDEDPEKWPFEIEQSSYTVKLDCLAGENVNGDAYARRQEITWNFKTRQDVTNGYKKVGYHVQYTNSADKQVNTTIYTYVKAVGAPGSGKGDATSTPRLIVTGFSTDPEIVKAGDEFTLTVHMQNTAKRTAVNNIEFTLKAATEGKDADAVYAAFLPVSGSNTIYVESIKAGGTTDLVMRLKAKTDLVQKPYVMDISMDFEDDKLTAYHSTSSVSIPVHQDARFEISEPEVGPNAIEVGSESNIMFSIYNTGKTTLYNVQVHFNGDSITGGDAFVGNINSGATGQVDSMVTGAAPTMDDGTITALITYEDSDGKVYEAEKTMNLFVSEPYIPDPSELEPMPEEPQGGIPKWIFAAAAALAAVGIGAGLIVRNKKKKARESELTEDMLAAEIDAKEAAGTASAPAPAAEDGKKKKKKKSE